MRVGDVYTTYELYTIYTHRCCCASMRLASPHRRRSMRLVCCHQQFSVLRPNTCGGARGGNRSVPYLSVSGTKQGLRFSRRTGAFG
eukprot:965874-Pyramimonas_sp.AAC.1